jgi:hypothetical protein
VQVHLIHPQKKTWKYLAVLFALNDTDMQL